jgi:hypothetical protein
MLTLAGPILDWHPFVNLDKHFQRLSYKPNLFNFSVHPKLIKTISTSKQTAVLNHALYHKIIKHDELTMFTSELENVLFFSMKDCHYKILSKFFSPSFNSSQSLNQIVVIWYGQDCLCLRTSNIILKCMHVCEVVTCNDGLLRLIIGVCDTQSIWEVFFMVPV